MKRIVPARGPNSNNEEPRPGAFRSHGRGYQRERSYEPARARAATSKKSVLVPDNREDPEWESIVGKKPEDYTWRCEVAVPVMVSNEVLAVLHAESPNPNDYNEQDVELLETLASHVASAIQRIRLLEAQHNYEIKLIALHQYANLLSKASNINEIADYTVSAMKNTSRCIDGDYRAVGR